MLQGQLSLKVTDAACKPRSKYYSVHMLHSFSTNSFVTTLCRGVKTPLLHLASFPHLFLSNSPPLRLSSLSIRTSVLLSTP